MEPFSILITVVITKHVCQNSLTAHPRKGELYCIHKIYFNKPDVKIKKLYKKQKRIVQGSKKYTA